MILFFMKRNFVKVANLNELRTLTLKEQYHVV
jgi:hypothetical protein